MFKRKIKTGIKLLSKTRPDWATDVNLDTLKMSSVCNCVLGQVAGDYEAGLLELGVDTWNDEEAGLLGFCLPDDRFDKSYDAIQSYDATQTLWSVLTREWKEIIREIRKKEV